MRKPRLKMLGPRIGTLAPRIAGAALTARAGTREERERIRLREREQSADCRQWYHSVRWKRLREEVLKRDLYTCRQTGDILTGKHPAPNSPVVDHIVPHNGDPALFWDPGNLQTVSKGWHDARKQAMEKGDQGAAMHPKWLMPSQIPLTIVCGPPASGKSAYVKALAGPTDLVIDLDTIAAQLSGEPGHCWDRDRWLTPALRWRNDMLGSLSRPSPPWPAAWFIVGEPKASGRHWWQAALCPQQIVVLEADTATCLANAGKDSDRDLTRTEAAVNEWRATYSPRPGDIRITEQPQPT